MTTRCPQCGATFASQETCTDRFNLTQSKEFENPAYFRVHHMSVPCYLIQHNRYSREGWLVTRQLLHDVVALELSQEATYRQSRAILEGGQRRWQFANGAKLAQVDELVWRWTIADVRFETAEQYCADVQEWVRVVLADTAICVQTLDTRR